MTVSDTTTTLHQPPYTNRAHFVPAASPDKGTYSTMNVYDRFGNIVGRGISEQQAALICAALNAYTKGNVPDFIEQGGDARDPR